MVMNITSSTSGDAVRRAAWSDRDGSACPARKPGFRDASWGFAARSGAAATIGEVRMLATCSRLGSLPGIGGPATQTATDATGHFVTAKIAIAAIRTVTITR
ncbi:hypothetical protein GCM10022224_023910 [Nonomuraea antimicrobica]|uniref:Uncharacterized protein n=1 Tax=Nonomuraea antimicrobica TaxID=561173 RepID=A0ABP7BHU6_9ACTN